MGWIYSQFHAFGAGGVGWGLPDPDDSCDGPPPASKTSLLSVHENVGPKTLPYIFDFGDNRQPVIKVEAALCLTMRFMGPQTQEQQRGAVLVRIRWLFSRQRTKAANALRAHLSEFGHIAPVGIQNVKQLVLAAETDSSDLPEIVRFTCKAAIEQIARLTERLAALDNEIAGLSGQCMVASRSQSAALSAPRLVWTLAAHLHTGPRHVKSRTEKPDT